MVRKELVLTNIYFGLNILLIFISHGKKSDSLGWMASNCVVLLGYLGLRGLLLVKEGNSEVVTSYIQ